MIVPLLHPDQHPGHDPESDDHVQRVQAGQHEVEREEDLRVLLVLGFEPEVESEAGDEVPFEYFSWYSYP